jgi:hypothetical protein
MFYAAAKNIGAWIAIAGFAAMASAQQVSSKPLKISDLVDVSLEGGQLVVHSNYSPNRASFSESVNIQGIAKPADLIIMRTPQGKLVQFGLTITTLVYGWTRTEIISLTPKAIEVIRSDVHDDHPDQPRAIELFQDAPGKNPRVELDRIDPDQTATELGKANSFVQFVNHHPHLADQFLRPIMQNDLQMEDVFGPTNMMAGIVLSTEIPVDPAMSKRVSALVDQLNSDLFADREAASRQLRDLGSDAVVCLLTMDWAKLSAEQDARIDEICRHGNAPSPEEIAALRKDVKFLLKCQLGGNRTIRLAALGLLQKAVGHEVTFDVDANFAARVAGVATLEARLIPSSATAPSAGMNGAAR